MAGEVHPPRRVGTLVLILSVAVLAFAGFVTLGVWQVHRLAWKERLIANVEQHAHMAPLAAPGPTGWAALTRGSDEYRHIRIRGRFLYDRDMLVRASTELGTGYWVLTPLQSDQGYWVLVNRGFVSSDKRETFAASQLAGEQEVTGLLRFSEPGGSMLQRNDPKQGRWYSRDVAAMSATQALNGAPVAPYFIDVDASGPSTGAVWPRPGLTVLHFSNNHLVYAFTWFALAAMVASAVAYVLMDERRLRRLARQCAHDTA